MNGGLLFLLLASPCAIQHTTPAVSDPAKSSECGVNCLFVALKTLDDNTTLTLNELRSRLAPGERGNNMEQLRAEAAKLGYATLVVRPSLESLAIRRRPFMCIAHLSRGHFIIIQDVDDGAAQIIDAPLERTVARESLEQQWSGVCLLIAREPLEPEETLQRRLYWSRITRKLPITALLATVLLSLTGWVIVRIRSTWETS